MANGDVKVSKDKYGNPTLEMETGLGTLRVKPNGDPGIYDEFDIDLITPDGRMLQVSVVGVTENKGIYDPELHAYVWDGRDEDIAQEQILHVGEDSYWYPAN